VGLARTVYLHRICMLISLLKIPMYTVYTYDCVVLANPRYTVIYGVYIQFWLTLLTCMLLGRRADG